MAKTPVDDEPQADSLLNHEAQTPDEISGHSSAGQNQHGNTSLALPLVPLSPTPKGAHHNVYAQTLNEQLRASNGDSIRNVALTGGYGVGKSSVLQHYRTLVVEQQRQELKQPRGWLKWLGGVRADSGIVEVSLSTLGLSSSEQGRSSDGDVKNAAGQRAELEDETNRIQKEIVKQLIYREKPHKTPASRFRRLSRTRRGITLLVWFLFGLGTALLAYLVGWSAQLESLIPIDHWIHLVNFVLGIVFIAPIWRFLRHRLAHSKIGVEVSSLKLKGEGESYFDEYIDEIVYFFEISRTHTVFFEDIDRFENPLIFETLRSLNTLLNSSKQLQENQPVRFIYAVKDSIFEKLGNEKREDKTGSTPRTSDDLAREEMDRANRTKFFDLVIPVVPFVSYRTSRKVLTEQLNELENHGISDELINLVSSDVSDMRFIKNLRNEFAVFRQQLITGQPDLGLEPDQVFAMVVYKNFHLSDFENIRHGKSQLNHVYDHSRKIVTGNLNRKQSEQRRVRAQLQELDPIATHAEALGEMLVGHLDRWASRLPVAGNYSRASISWDSLEADGTSWSKSSLSKPEFWRRYLDEKPMLEVRFRESRTSSSTTFEMDAEEVARILGHHRLLTDPVGKQDREGLQSKLASLYAEEEVLRSGQLATLYRVGDLQAPYEGGDPQSLKDIVDAKLESALAKRLLAEGYLDHNFALYASTFPVDGGVNATRFLAMHVYPNRMDIHFELTGEEAREVVDEAPRTTLSSPGMYNVSIVDYLAESEDPGLKDLVESLTKGSEEASEFIDQYLPAGKQVKVFVRWVAPRYPDIFALIADHPGLEDEMRIQLLDTAFLSTDVLLQDFNFGSRGLSEHIVRHAKQLRTFTDTRTAEASIQFAVVAATEYGQQIEDLEPLSTRARKVVVAESAYKITRRNLELAVGSENSSDLALNAMRQNRSVVFRTTVNRLAEYVRVMPEDELLINDASEFSVIVHELPSKYADAAAQIIARSAEGSQLADLHSSSQEHWPALAENGRFASTFVNVKAYAEYWGLDGPLETFLKDAVDQLDVGEAEADELESFAQEVAGSKEFGDSTFKARVIRAVMTGKELSTELVDVAPTELVCELFVQGAELNSLLVLPRIAEGGKELLARALATIENIDEALPDGLIRGDYLPYILESPDIDDEVKNGLIRSFDAYVTHLTPSAATEITQRGLGQWRFSVEQLIELATAGAGKQALVDTLAEDIEELSNEDLRSVLVAMGGEYKKLTERKKHPRIPASPAAELLLERLKSDVVSKWGPDDRYEGYLRVHNRTKQ